MKWKRRRKNYEDIIQLDQDDLSIADILALMSYRESVELDATNLIETHGEEMAITECRLMMGQFVVGHRVALSLGVTGSMEVLVAVGEVMSEIHGLPLHQTIHAVHVASTVLDRFPDYMENTDDTQT